MPDYEDEIFSISSGRVNKKRRSRRHFSKGFQKNVAVAKTSAQKLEVSPFCDREKA